MNRKITIGFLLLVFTSSAFSQEGFEGRPITDNVWMPTGYTLNKGEFKIGLGSIGFGISDNVQAGTNILLFLFQVSNVNLKISAIKTPTQALGVGIDFAHFDLDIFGEEVDASFTSISPFVAYSTQAGEKTMIHLAGRLSTFSGDAEIDDAKAEESSTGTSVFAGVEHSYSNRTKFLGEVGYDITFEGLRLGGAVLFGWTKFRLKMGVSYFNPDGPGDFTLPVIGLWWRFKG
ncbi:MAG: hypothetical protein V3U73_05665 [bacterium]